MATPLQVPSSAVLKILWSAPNRNFQNVLGLRWTSAAVVPSQAMVDTIFTNIKANAATTTLLSLMGSNVALFSISLKDINTPNQTEFTSTGAAAAGTGVGDTLSLSLAQVVTLRTPQSGKSFRGRMYFSGFTEAQNDATGRALAAVSTACTGWLTAWNTVLNGQGFAIAVLHRNSAGRTIPEKIIAPTSGFSTTATAFLVRNTKWESQRRRTGRS